MVIARFRVTEDLERNEEVARLFNRSGAHLAPTGSAILNVFNPQSTGGLATDGRLDCSGNCATGQRWVALAASHKPSTRITPEMCAGDADNHVAIKVVKQRIRKSRQFRSVDVRPDNWRSEERRVGKECRYRWSP